MGCKHRIDNKIQKLPLDYPSINFQQDVDFLTKYLYANDWNARDAIKKIVQLYRIKVRTEELITI